MRDDKYENAGAGLLIGRKSFRLVGNSCVYLIQPDAGGARHLHVAAVKKWGRRSRLTIYLGGVRYKEKFT